ncbi:hypothetical protein SAMN05443572_10879 [Myxococcus fulvus]|uniref:Periplasmic heavy metal sensor n=2 Tax=Myxococcus fulvus TaxID=33 RepID=A0A511T3Z3_MYXFU|nr:hypothetical protein [Myxococcus fulvus]GEN08884.1 hypothetical protein MFU01_39210 [Myxococcus fulvus]SEU28788.1 hypothetical protein SAMN05443572_10879 [Myxococcus fulvus]
MKTMTRTSWVMLSVVLVPWLALAKPGDKGEERSARVTERMERLEKRQRLRQVLALSEALELDNQQALKMEQTLRQFDEKRRPLREQVREAARTLHQAARGDSAALAQVDAAAQRAFEARERITVLDREMYQALAKELPPDKRAKLALTLARDGGRMKRPWRGEGPGDAGGDD